MGIAAALSLSCGAAMAQDYPAYDINGIIQWGAGGAVDTVARASGAIAEQELGRKIVMTNRTGGAGLIAMRHVLAQAPDGYTVLFGSAELPLYKAMGLADIDYEELYPVNLLIEEPNLIVVPADSPYQTFSDLLEDVKARPGQVRMAHFGNGTTSQVISLMFQSVTDFEANMVPFDGAAAAMTASMGGALDMVNVGISIGKPMIESGRMRALTIISDEVHSHFPDVPPLTEFLPETKKFLPWGAFYGVYADKDIPDAAKAKLSAAFDVATKDPKFSDVMNDRGVKILSLSGDDAVAYIKRYQSITAWLLYDGGAIKDSPETFGIARP